MSPVPFAAMRVATGALACAATAGCAPGRFDATDAARRSTAQPDMTRAAATGASADAVRRDARHRTCAARMYAERSLRGRGAPNWILYDQCMRHGSSE